MDGEEVLVKELNWDRSFQIGKIINLKNKIKTLTVPGYCAEVKQLLDSNNECKKF